MGSKARRILVLLSVHSFSKQVLVPFLTLLGVFGFGSLSMWTGTAGGALILVPLCRFGGVTLGLFCGVDAEVFFLIGSKGDTGRL